MPQQNKAHLPFDYSLTKPKGRCECANFRIARSVLYYNELWVLGQNTMHLYFGLNRVIPCICNKPSPCLHKKYNELLLSDYTFYSELCKCPQIAGYYKDYFRFIFLLNSFSVWICQRLLRVMERKVREQKNSTRKIFGMQNFSPFWKAFSDPRLHQLWTVVWV